MADSQPSTPRSVGRGRGISILSSSAWRAQVATKPTPLDLSVDRDTKFKIWKRRWESYFRLSGLESASELTQYDVFTSCLSDETLKVVDNFDIPVDDAHKVDKLLECLAQYARGQINESVEHHHLYKRRQQSGERFDDFYTDLRELSHNCGFCSPCLQKVLRDCIVLGVQSDDLRRTLLAEHSLTLDKAVQSCRNDEAASLHQSSLSDHVPHVGKVEKSPGPTDTRPSPQSCQFCGGPPHARHSCPANGRKCNKCGVLGHFAKVCRSEKASDGDRPYRRRAVASIIAAASHIDPAPKVIVSASSLNGKALVHALPDTGADICAAGVDFLHALGEDVSNLWSITEDDPQAANGLPMSSIGRLAVDISLGDITTSADIHIIDGVTGLLLSWSTSRDLALIPSAYPAQIGSVSMPPDHPHDKLMSTEPQVVSTVQLSSTMPTREDLMKEFPTVFDGVVRAMPGEVFQICLKDGAKPFSVTSPRRVPFPKQEKLEAQIKKLESAGIIAPVTEPTEWCSPIVVADKKSSDEVCLCVDFTRLNQYVMRERYQSPTPLECVAAISAGEAKMFTTFDALKGYHQCPLDEASQLLTTFITPFGRYKYLRAPFGICSISEHYNRRMNMAFQGLHGFSKLVDDVVVYDSTVTSHVTHVRQFLQRCSDCGISLNPDKFNFAKTEVPFAGFQLSPDGYCIHPDLTDAIRDFPPPDNITKLRSFVGLVNQLSSFTACIADILQPLRPLLSSKNTFLWLDVHQQAFLAVKAALVSPPTLCYYDMSKPLRLHTDGSLLNGLGFVLQQKHDDGHWHILQAGSRFLTPTESRYAAIELELLAVVWAVTKCHLFLGGVEHFDIVTDHKPLLPILNSKLLHDIPNPRLQRLKQKLMEYVFTAHWNKGVTAKLD